MNKLIIILIAFLLSSCKTETSKSWTIYNYTSGNIHTEIIEKSTHETQTYDLAPNESVVIKQTTVKSRDEEGKPSDPFLSLLITNTAGDACLKDYKLDDNWELINNTKSPPKRIYIQYNFEVYDSDF
jgi:hypothetical protein